MAETDSTQAGGDSFVVDIKFRRHATWQGTITHRQTGQKLPFRSELEMMKIIDSALQQKYGEDYIEAE